MAKSAKARKAKKPAPKRVPPIPPGHHTVTPYLTVNDGAKALDFYTRAFGARVTERMPGPGGKLMHAEAHARGVPHRRLGRHAARRGPRGEHHRGAGQ